MNLVLRYLSVGFLSFLPTILLGASFTLTPVVQSSNDTRVNSRQKVLRIPFEFYRNKFRFSVTINNKPFYMMLDNGSLWDELLFFGNSKLKDANFHFSDTTQIGLNTADIAHNVAFQIDRTIFNHQTAVVTRYDPESPNLWEGFDGQISGTFFKHFIVKINFQENYIELIPPKNFEYQGSSKAIKMQSGPHGSKIISAIITFAEGNQQTQDLVVDLGGIYPLYLPIQQNDVFKDNKNLDTIGQAFIRQKGYQGKVAAVDIGAHKLTNVNTAFNKVSSDTHNFGSAMIGLPLLRRFNVTFDYFKNQLYLEPIQDQE